jgi:hypothetical protein
LTAAPAVSTTFTVVENVAPCSMSSSENAAILILPKDNIYFIAYLVKPKIKAIKNHP